jgi:DNA-directed RNA polymerase subunit RPC12/RpoP
MRMSPEKYVLNCPRCGRVEGLIESDIEDDPDSLPEAEHVIAEEVVRTASGTHARIRCPRCGSWIGPDRAGPA